MKVIRNIGQLNFVNKLELQAHHIGTQFDNYKAGALIMASNQLPSFNLVIDGSSSAFTVAIVCAASEIEEEITSGFTINNDAFVVDNITGELQPYLAQEIPYYTAPYTQFVNDGEFAYDGAFTGGYFYLKITDNVIKEFIYSNVFKLDGSFKTVTSEHLLATDTELLLATDTESILVKD